MKTQLQIFTLILVPSLFGLNVEAAPRGKARSHGTGRFNIFKHQYPDSFQVVTLGSANFQVPTPIRNGELVDVVQTGHDVRIFWRSEETHTKIAHSFSQRKSVETETEISVEVEQTVAPNGDLRTISYQLRESEISKVDGQLSETLNMTVNRSEDDNSLFVSGEINGEKLEIEIAELYFRKSEIEVFEVNMGTASAYWTHSYPSGRNITTDRIIISALTAEGSYIEVSITPGRGINGVSDIPRWRYQNETIVSEVHPLTGAIPPPLADFLSRNTARPAIAPSSQQVGGFGSDL